MTRELIERYRAQNFQRKVMERVPLDLDHDEVTLSCGHKKQMDVHLIEASDHQLNCKECANEWLANEERSNAGNGDSE